MIKMKFIANEDKYVIYKNVYEAIWRKYGKKIITSIEKVTNLKYLESEINAIVGEGDASGSNFAGSSIDEPMLFRYSVRDKLGTMCHELGHRFIMEHDYYNLTKSNLKISDDHQLLDLFLYDSMEMALGNACAEERKNYECTFPDSEFKSSWEWAFKYNYDERQKLLSNCAKLIR